MTDSTRSRTTHLTLAVVGLFAFYVVGVIVRQRYGISIAIRNESGETLRQVSVKVESIGDRGTRYQLPDLTQGGRVRVYAQPVSESHIGLEFVDAANTRHAETVVGYAETGYCGSIAATIRPGGRVELNGTISNLACWKGWLDFIS